MPLLCHCTVPTGTFPPDSNKHEGWCSGDWTLGMVADRVVIPKELSPGRYVLSWRMDCEETAQVWSSCADVNVVPRRHTVEKIGDVGSTEPW